MRDMRTLLCQINTTPGDFAGNIQAIKAGIVEGYAHRADLIVFPELAIPGYLMKDMVFDSHFVEQNLERLEEIKACSDVVSKTQTAHRHPAIVVGYVDYNRTGVGKPFRNMAAVIRDGVIIGTYAKQLLPFYDVFDEGRYFQPGTELCVIDICDEKWGICICEDVWNDKGMEDYNYANNPIQQYRNIGVYNIISINSSPFVRGKSEKRMNMLKSITRLGDIEVGRMIYVNQYGGQDELVFDGHSMIVENGRISYFAETKGNHLYDEREMGETLNAAAWRHDNYFADRDLKDLHEAISTGLYDYVTKSGFKEVVVGSSGGIDSAVVIALACEVFGPKNVHGIRMPSIHSSEGSKDDALLLHQNLGCQDYLVPIEHQPWIDSIIGGLSNTPEHIKDIGTRKYNSVADENIQARMRGDIVMYFSNAFGPLALTTGNKTELALGYCTLYGDMNGGFAPINGLYKLDVYEMARYLNRENPVIPFSIIQKAPSAELDEGQTDEKSLLPYVLLDPIVRGCIEGRITSFEKYKQKHRRFSTAKEVFDWVSDPKSEVEYNRMIRLIKLNEFKRRQAAPGIKVNSIDFGTGRRYPIVKR